MKTTGCEFIKPFGEKLPGPDRAAYYPYPREKLTAEPVFPYFVLDGGAFNFANNRFGTADGDGLLELTMSGRLFDVFTFEGKFDWERSFAYTADTGFDRKYEWQVWPQRLYMTIPVAQAFLRTGDRRYSDAWLAIVKAWDRAHPYQEFDENIHYLKTDMVWRDMQAAWRSLSLMHGMFMLEDAPFDGETWDWLYRFLGLHVRHLYKEAADRLRRGVSQNHVLQIGTALIMAGALYPEFADADLYVKTGRDIVAMNLRGAICPDGGSIEDSPSYSHFIARLYLEAYLLLERNGLETVGGLKESISAQYEWLWQCMSPAGRVLRLSDSYGMDAEADIRRAGKLIGLDFSREKKSVYFRDSRVAVLRSGPLTLAADAMEHLGGHQHYGRPQTLLFYGNEPVLVDSGCCDYDIWDFYRRLRSAEAHNVVYCPDFPDEQCRIEPGIGSFDEAKREIALTCRVACGGRSYVWERLLHLDDDGLTVEDHASSEDPLKWAANFYLARRDIRIDPGGRTASQLSDRFIVKITADRTFEAAFAPVMNEENRIDYARCLRFSAEGKTFGLKTVLRFTER